MKQSMFIASIINNIVQWLMQNETEVEVVSLKADLRTKQNE